MLQRFGATLFFLVFTSLFATFAALSLLAVAAVVVPLLGLGWATLRFRLGRALATSSGRVEFAGTTRLFRVSTLRRLALCEYVSGAGGFVASLAVPMFLASAVWLAFAALGIGFAAVSLASTAQKRLVASAGSVEILPAGE